MATRGGRPDVDAADETDAGFTRAARRSLIGRPRASADCGIRLLERAAPVAPVLRLVEGDHPARGRTGRARSTASSARGARSRRSPRSAPPPSRRAPATPLGHVHLHADAERVIGAGRGRDASASSSIPSRWRRPTRRASNSASRRRPSSDEACLLVGALGPRVERVHLEFDAMQADGSEGVRQHRSRRLGAVAPAEPAG